jgi:hypothetical protein
MRLQEQQNAHSFRRHGRVLCALSAVLLSNLLDRAVATGRPANEIAEKPIGREPHPQNDDRQKYHVGRHPKS